MSLRLLAAVVPAVISTLATAVGIVLFVLSPRESAPIELRAENTYPLIAMQVSLLTVGAAISWRHPANPIGWLLSATGLAAGFVYFAGGYATYGMLSANGLPSADVVAWIFSWAKLAMGLSLPPIFFLFPDGRFRSRRDRIGLVTGLTALLLGVGVLALSPGPLLGILFVQNPFGWNAGAAALKLAFAVACVLGFVFLFLGTSSLRARYRRASGLERQQLKWLYGAAGLYVVTLVVILPPYLAEWLGIPVDAFIRYLANLIGGLAYTIFPIAIGIAILRHRLYDIDVLINRTLVYGATTATLLGLYAVIVLVALAVLRPLTQGSELAVAASTLVVASLIQPVRRRVQSSVDRRFYRSRYDAARIIDALAVRMRDEVDLDALRGELVAVVRETMKPAHAELWLRERSLTALASPDRRLA